MEVILEVRVGKLNSGESTYTRRHCKTLTGMAPRGRFQISPLIQNEVETTTVFTT